MNKKNFDRAEQLMRDYAQTLKNKQVLEASIANEMASYKDNLKKFEAELLEIGTKHLDEFDADGNFRLSDGYLHIVNSAVVVTKKSFDAVTFREIFPDWISIELKKGPIKKAFTDATTRKELAELGVSLDNEQSLQVIPNKE